MEQLKTQVKCRIRELCLLEQKLNDLQKVQDIDRVLGSGMCCVGVSRVHEDAMVDTPIDITAMMNEQEIAVLLKAIQVTLSFTKERIQREIDEVNCCC